MGRESQRSHEPHEAAAWPPEATCREDAPTAPCRGLEAAPPALAGGQGFTRGHRADIPTATFPSGTVQMNDPQKLWYILWGVVFGFFVLE